MFPVASHSTGLLKYETNQKSRNVYDFLCPISYPPLNAQGQPQIGK